MPNFLIFLLIGILASPALSVEAPHPCVADRNCSCTNLWNSDCYCSQPNGGVCTNCAEITKECWRPQATHTSCNVTGLFKLSVKLFTTSLDKAGLTMMNKMKEVIEHFSAVQFQLIFILSSGERKWIVNGVASQRDADELSRDKWIACAQTMNHKQDSFFPLLYCINRHPDYAVMSQYYQECALGHGYEPRDIEECYKRNGLELLFETWTKYRMSDALGDKDLKNPTVVVDGVIFQENQTVTVENFVEALCYRFLNPDTSADISWVPSFTGLLFIQFFVLLWIIKRDDMGDEYARPCNVLSMCFEEEYNEEMDVGEAVLENWAREGLEDEQLVEMESDETQDNPREEAASPRAPRAPSSSDSSSDSNDINFQVG